MRMQGGSRWRSCTHVVGGIGRVLKPVVGAQAGQGAAQQEGAAEVGRRRPAGTLLYCGTVYYHMFQYAVIVVDNVEPMSLTVSMSVGKILDVVDSVHVVAKDNAVDTKVDVADNVHIVDIVDAVDDACTLSVLQVISIVPLEKGCIQRAQAFGPPCCTERG